MSTLKRAQRTMIGIGTGAAMLAAALSPVLASSAQAGGVPTAGVTIGGVVSPASVTSVSTSPSSAAPGDSFNVSGSGFTPGDTVSIEFGGDTIGTATVDANGNFSTTATVPTHMPEGEHPLDVNGMTGASKDTNYTVSAPRPPAPTPTPAPYYVPRVSSTPGSAPAGGTVTFTGSGFRPGEWVTISFGGSDIATVRADTVGEFTTSGQIPNDMPAGDHPLDANGDLGSSWDGELGVSAPKPTPTPAPQQSVPQVGMAPGSAEQGARVTFTGSGFLAHEQVTIMFGGDTIASATANSKGEFSTSGHVPMHIPAGSHPLDVNGSKGSSFDGELTVLAKPVAGPTPKPVSTPVPTATPKPASTPAPAATPKPATQPSTPAVQARVGIAPGSAAPGELLTIAGTGFKAGEQISVEFGGETIATATASAAGAFRTTGRVPAHMPVGSHPIEVNGSQGNTLSGSFPVKAATTTASAPATTKPVTSQPAASAPAPKPVTSQPTATASAAAPKPVSPAATQPTTGQPAATASTTSPAAARPATVPSQPAAQVAATSGASNTSQSSIALAGPAPADAEATEDSDETAVLELTETTSDASDEAASAPATDETSVLEAAERSSEMGTQLMFALIAMGAAMPVLAGAGWVLGTRRTRRTDRAPRRRSW